MAKKELIGLSKLKKGAQDPSTVREGLVVHRGCAGASPSKAGVCWHDLSLLHIYWELVGATDNLSVPQFLPF